MIVGSRLREAREKHNFTQEYLGEMLGLSKSAISLYEHEKRNPTIENIIELMYVLGVSADYLLGADVIVEIKDEEDPKYRTLTKEEIYVITELRKDKIIYDTIFQNPKRGVEMLKKRI